MSNDPLGIQYLSDLENEPNEALRNIMSQTPPQKGGSSSASVSKDPKWAGDYPNAYGVYGVVKEVGKTMLPWLKYIDPEEREKFMQLSQQEQVRDLLFEDLNFVTLGRWKPIAQGVKEVAGAAMQTYLPKTYETLVKTRRLPNLSFKGIENAVEPVKSVTVPVTPAPQAAKGTARVTEETLMDTPVVSDDAFKKVSELANNWETLIDKQKRGVRPHELARQEAENIGYTYDEIKNLAPGTTMNDSQVVALTNVVKSVADETLAAAQSGDRELFMKRFLALAEVDPARWGVRTEAGRTLSIMNEPISGINQYLDQFTAALEAGNITPERLMAMVSKLKTPAQMAEVAKAALRPGFTDAILEVWINGLLSGPVSHAANIAGNLLMLSSQPVERFGAAAIGNVFPGQPAIPFGEAPQMIYGMIEGFKDGFRLGAKALMGGAPQTGAQKIEWKKAVTAALFGVNDDTGLGGAINLLGDIIRVPGRSLMSADEFFKGVAGRMELRGRAYREGIANGFEGEDLAKFMAAEINKPSAATKNAVSEFQKYITFQTELGKSGQAFQDFVASHPAWKIVFPFVKTPANIFKAFGERTPLALFSKSIQADIKAGGAKRDLAISRITLGTMLAGITASYVSDGRITGGGPSDPNLRAAKMRDGWQPYSIKIGNAYHSYARFEPLSTLIGTAASAAELLGEIEGDAIEAEDLPIAVISAFTKNVLDKTFTQGAANLILALEDPKQFGRQYASQLAGSIIPSFSAQLSRSIDGDVKDIRNIMDAMKSRIPGLSKDVPSKLNLWGEKIEFETLGPKILSPIRVSKAKDSPADNEIVKHRVSIAMPTRQIYGVELTPEEYNRYVQLAGNEAKGPDGMGCKDSLEAMLNNVNYQRQSDGPDGGKALMLKSKILNYRELARLMMIEESPELAERVRGKQAEKRESLMPNF